MVDVDRLAYSLGKSLRAGVDKLNAVVDENSSKMADLAGRVAAGMESGGSGEARAGGVDPRATVPAAQQHAKPDYLREVERWVAAAPESERGDGRGVAVDLAMRLPDGGNRVTRPTVDSQPDRSAVAVMAGIMAAKLRGMVAGEEVRQFPTSPTAIALFAVQTGGDGFMEMVPLAVVHATRVPSGSAAGQPVPYNPYDREWPWESGDVSKWKYMSEDLVTVLGE